MSPEEYVRYYLPRLGSDGNAFYGLIHAPDGALPHLTAAFRLEREPARSAAILEVIWQLRVPAAIPVLEEALFDARPIVWKEALNGLVALDRPECISALERARGRSFERDEDARSFREWVDEALGQLRQGFVGEGGPSG